MGLLQIVKNMGKLIGFHGKKIALVANILKKQRKTNISRLVGIQSSPTPLIGLPVKILIFLLFLFTTSIHAEGTKQWIISNSDYSFLKVNSGGNYSFAGYGVAANKRLYIHIKDPENEVVYIGLSRFVEENSSGLNDLGTAYQFQIKSPSGATVHGPHAVSSPNLTSYEMAKKGPATVYAGGYPTNSAMWVFDPSGKGLSSGDYYIEFKTAGAIRWFDITVASAGANPTAKDGRLWSQAWAVRATDGFGDGQYFDEPFNGTLIAYDGKYATKIDFQGSGIRPLEGQFSFNDTGTGTSGNKANDRKSVNGKNSGNPGHKIFLNLPDPTVYPLQAEGTLQNLPLKVADPANPAITVEVSQPGRIEVLLDFGGGNKNKRLFANVISGSNQIPWDGKTGEGVAVQPSDYPIPVNVSYTQGETHFTAYDVEGLDNGFKVFTQTSIGTIGPRKQFWDDSGISDSPGTAGSTDAQTNVDTGADTRRRWNNNNYGDLNTINTWWFSYRDAQTSTVLLPGDYGDAPDTYGNAVHKVVQTQTVYLGVTPPDEEDGAATPQDGTGDNATNTDDEDAISSFPELTIADSTYTLPANSITVTNTSGATVKMYAYIDFNNNGVFTDAGESISVDVLNGATNPAADLVFTNFSKAITGGTIYARFRIASTAADISQPSSGASDGEVEDYALTLLGIDYGDAPSTYGNGFHILPATSLVYLGATSPDGESQSQNTANGGADGSGDDSAGTDDEDGVTVDGNDLQGQSFSLGKSYTFDTEINGSGVLNAWFDWNADGDFEDTGEYVIQEKGVSTGTDSSSFSIPGIVQIGDTYARFRICPAAGQCNDPSSSTQDGEIEDYSITIEISQPNSCVVGSALTVGNATITSSGPNGSQEYQITPDQNNRSGALWGKEKVTLLAPFDLTMFVYAGNKDAGGADGFAFLFHNDPRGTTTLGNLGGGIGYSGIRTGFVVEFDTYRNGNEPANDHTAVSLSGKGNTLDSYSTAQHIMPVKDLGNIEDNKYHLVRLVWEPITQVFSYYFDGELLASKNVDLVSQVGESALWGFTASTGGSRNRHAACFQNIFPPITNDYSDAPDSYGGANHYIPQGGNVFLGSTPPDSESGISLGADNGATASGDDTSGDDEDGVSSFNVLTDSNGQYSVDITVNNPLSKIANVMGWIDFDGNGVFNSDEASALVTVPAGTSNGTVTLNWNSIPADIKMGNTYARFRITTDAMAATDTEVLKLDGEVEDYSLTIVEPDYDYGDAPDDGVDFKYGLAKHIIPQVSDGLSIGIKKATKDEEADRQNWLQEWDSNGKHKDWFKKNKGRRSHGNGHRKKDEAEDPSPDVVGDGDEEDGLVTTALSWNNGTTCTGILPDGTNGSVTMTDTRYCITVTASNSSAIAAQLVGWIDFNQNGEFDDPSERSVVDVDADTSNDTTQGNVPAGTANQPIVIYWENQTKVSGGLNTYIRLRLTSDPEFKSNNSPDPIGVAINGEVEDTNIGINVEGTDYGDAPDSYGDASHIIELDAYMGTVIDNDNLSQNTANGGADGVGDDNDGYNDDDGVASFSVLATNLTSYSIDITATTPIGQNANLVGWIDFDGNGTFDTDEAATVVVSKNSTDVVATLTWSTIPADIKSGNSYVRLRLSSDNALTTSTPTGLVTDGEVEDYALEIQGTLDVTKTTSTPNIVAGEFANYTITVTNNTAGTIIGVQITDTPEDTGFFYDSSSVTLLDTNTANAAPTRTATNNPVALSNPMVWGSFTIPAGDSVEIAVTMNVFSGTGTYNNSVMATTTTSGTAINNYDGASGTVEDVTIGNALCTTTTQAKVFYGSSTGDIYSINLATGDQRLVTNTALQGFANRGLNALATNPDVDGIAYYGNGTQVFYWNPSEGSGASAHHLMKDLSGFDEFTGGFLDSGGGSYLEGVYYVGAELSNGAITDVYALTLSADGKSVLSAKALGVQAASGNTLGGFGDFIVTSEGMEGTVYGGSTGGYWSFDIATKTYERIAGYPGQLSTDQNGQLWRGNATFNMLNKLTGAVSGSPSYSPLSAIYDLTGPYNCPQFDTDVYDYGDAPASYGDASHLILNIPKVYIGAVLPDDETETLLGGDAGIDADGDDAANTNDEEGVTSFPELTDISSTYELDVVVQNTSGNVANLVGWIDFDGDGVFASDEAATLAVNSGANGTTVKLKWNAIPTDIEANDQSYLRLRFTSDTNIATGTANTSLPTTLAADGEVEDYPILIKVGGFPVKGRVYKDGNVDGVNEASEGGISGLPIVLLDVANNTCVSTRTDADGHYEFFPVIPGDYQLYEASRETIPLPQSCDVTKAKDPAGYRSTTNNALAQFSVVDAEITGKDFGDINDPVFAPDNSGTVLAGNVVFYAHKFTPPSTGTVTFTSVNTTLVTAGWSNVIYQDLDCNGKLDGIEANAPVTSLATTANTNICLVNKVYAPTAVVNGEIFANAISAVFDFNGNAIAGSKALKVTDLTKAAANTTVTPTNPTGGNSKLELRKTVQNLGPAGTDTSRVETETQNQAKPGDVLKYRIYYSNVGNAPLTDLIINDAVPDFTTITGSPDCETPLPVSLTKCIGNISASDIEWTFGVGDVLEGGSEGVVSYEVTID